MSATEIARTSAALKSTTKCVLPNAEKMDFTLQGKDRTGILHGASKGQETDRVRTTGFSLSHKCWPFCPAPQFCNSRSFEPASQFASLPSTHAFLCRGLSFVEMPSNCSLYLLLSGKRGWPGLVSSNTERQDDFMVELGKMPIFPRLLDEMVIERGSEQCSQ